ncbi:hypothetical protein FPV67DRAFT_290542 [Lyophyllum atratum]|nr:hypothetical protein FPV67DRAFT_290542 [Lyophyllum atratum]
MQSLTHSEHPRKRRCVNDAFSRARSSATVARKPLRGRKGRLVGLPDLPMDILYEIFGHLRPLDLLRLARSWKKMRAFLMNRNARWIWRQSLSRLEGFPECPPGMSEPQLTNLMFSAHCHYCGAEPVPTIIWLTQNRACKRCFPKHFQQAKHLVADAAFSILPEECWKFAQLSGRIVHSTTFMPITSRDTCRRIVNLELLQKFSAEYAIVEGHPCDLEDWLTRTRRHHEAWAKIAESLAAWQDEQTLKRGLALDAARRRRLNAVIRNLNAAGWKEDLGKMDLDLLRQHELVKIPRDLTERVWVKIRPKIIDFMERVGTRLREEYRLEQITRRRRIFSEYITECHTRYAIPAPISELSQFEPFKSIMEDPSTHQVITIDSFPPPRAMFQLFCNWHKHRKHNLVQIMRRSALVPWHVGAAQIKLATTFFHCRGPGFREPIGQEDALIHPASFSWRPERDYSSEYLTRLFEDFQQEYWNYGDDRISFHEPAFLAARAIVIACGCDPDTTTAAAMDRWSCLFECISCKSSMTGRLVMTWRRAVIHAIDHLNVLPQLPSAQWTVTDSAEACHSAALAQIFAEVPFFRCHLCYIFGDASFMSTHIKERHTLPQTVTIMRQPPSAVRIPNCSHPHGCGGAAA